MAGFPLLSLYSRFQESVIKKLEGKSYMRLQQTCHGMADFIKNARNVRVRCVIFASLGWEDSGITLVDDYEEPLHIESMYGVRFETLWIQPEVYNNFELLCETLKRYRIACKRLYINEETVTVPNKAQCVELLKLLTPKRIGMNSIESDRMKAVLPTKSLTKVTLRVALGDAFLALKFLVPHFPKIEIDAEKGASNSSRSLNIDELFNVLKASIEYLCTVPLPNLRYLFFTVTCGETLPPLKEQLERLEDYHPTVLKSLAHSQILQCSLRSGGPFFEIIMYGHFATIYYKSGS